MYFQPKKKATIDVGAALAGIGATIFCIMAIVAIVFLLMRAI